MLDYIIWGAIIGAIGGVVIFFLFEVFYDLFTFGIYVGIGGFFGSLLGILVYFIQWWIIVPALIVLFLILQMWWLSYFVLIIALFFTSWWWVSIVLIILGVLFFIFGSEGEMTWVRPHERRMYGRWVSIRGHQRRLP